MEIKFVIIGDLSGRRVQAFIECLKKSNIHTYQVLSWLELVKSDSAFVNSIEKNTVVKIEPPEKDMNIYRELLKLGDLHNGLKIREINEIDFSYFPIIAPRQWYEGLENLLINLQDASNNLVHKNIVWLNDINETLLMMDKCKTYDFLATKTRETEFYLPSQIAAPTNYNEFKEIHGEMTAQYFIKLRYGSGGTGVLAYKNNPKLNQEKIWTSLNFEVVGGKKIFYSNNKVNCFEDKNKVKELIHWVLVNGAHIEEWIPKATYQGASFDTRAFVLQDKAEYLISRLSKSPITNLHLGNQRMESKAILSKEQVATIATAAEKVMKLFNQSTFAGIDIVCSTGFRPYVIDVNPFGDFFHNLLGTEDNVHYLEIKAAIRRVGRLHGY